MEDKRRMISNKTWKILLISLSLYYTMTGIILERLLNSIVIKGDTQYIRNTNSWLRIIWFSFLAVFTLFFIIKSIKCKISYDEIPADTTFVNFSKIEKNLETVKRFNNMISIIFVAYIFVTFSMYASMLGSTEFEDITSSNSSTSITALIVLNMIVGLVTFVTIITFLLMPKGKNSSSVSETK